MYTNSAPIAKIQATLLEAPLIQIPNTKPINTLPAPDSGPTIRSSVALIVAR